MSLRTHWSKPTTPAGPGFDVELVNAIPVAQYSPGSQGFSPSDALTGLVTAAIEGDVASSTVVLDDPDGTLDIDGGRMYFVEDAIADANDNVVWNGYVDDSEEARGEDHGLSPRAVARQRPRRRQRRDRLDHPAGSPVARPPSPAGPPDGRPLALHRHARPDRLAH